MIYELGSFVEIRADEVSRQNKIAGDETFKVKDGHLLHFLSRKILRLRLFAV